MTRDNEKLKKVLSEIEAIARTYGTEFTRIGCLRYYNMKSSEFKLKKEIANKERELSALKRKVM